MVLRQLRGGSGLPWRRLLTAVLAAAAIFAYWTQLSDKGDRPLVRESIGQPRSEGEAKGFGLGIGFASERRLDEHFQKHGAEFGRITRLDYLHQAQMLRDAPLGGPVLETRRADGVS